MQLTTVGSLEVGRIGLGCMGMLAPDADPRLSIGTIQHAIDLGVTLIDTAEVYGPYSNEQLLGRALRGRRDAVVLATKFGLISHIGAPRGVPDSRPANVRLAVEGSLRRLRTDRIDLYYQHRVDPHTPIEETIGVLSDLITEGKIRHIGLSEAWAGTIRRAHAVHPITALQSEFSLWTCDPETAIFPILDELGIGFVPYSPLGRGLLTGAIRSRGDLPAGDPRITNPRFTVEHLPANVCAAERLRGIAHETGATVAQVSLAWVLAKVPQCAPIPGTKRIDRLEENLGALELVLSADQMSVLDGIIPARGNHHSPEQMRLLDRSD